MLGDASGSNTKLCYSQEPLSLLLRIKRFRTGGFDGSGIECAMRYPTEFSEAMNKDLLVDLALFLR